MTKFLILTIGLVLLYLYWKQQSNKSLPPNPGQPAEVFFDAEDWASDNSNHD